MEEKNFLKSLKKTKCFLYFKGGTNFTGWVNLDKNDERLKEGIWGEATFTTAMSGYQETITDKSFLGQHIIFATAHVGNYPSSDRDLQASKSYASSIIAKNFSYNKFLSKTKVPIFTCFDTRALIKYITSKKGSHTSVITTNKKSPEKKSFSDKKLICNKLELVSKKGMQIIIKGKNPIVLIDYGCKNGIIENLKKLRLPLVIVGAETNAEKIISLSPRLIFLSNGPGDPRVHKYQIEVLKQIFKSNIPIRGICLGHQLLTLALGGKIIKLPFGQRGTNHPVIEHTTGKILITSQNHGYATEEKSIEKIKKDKSLNKEFYISYTSLFDCSVEGLASTDGFLKSVQFHPEASPGPNDAIGFFEEITTYLNKKQKITKVNTLKLEPFISLQKTIKKKIPYNKILIIGSGPIKIGQASEFDYSGTQACKVLVEIGVEVVLLNSNPATIMTDPSIATKTYIEPITKDTLKKIVKREKIDAILSTMGGQTALNLCMDLSEENYFKRNKIELLGANIDTIRKTEDRDMFAAEVESLGYKAGKRFNVFSKNECLKTSEKKLSYPLIIRRNFALGGQGAVTVSSKNELKKILDADMIFPATLERGLYGWKEIELEVMVDKEQNAVIVCSIENIDPCGVHTGDSITVAPAQTLSDNLYHRLRTMSLNIAKHMGVVAGGANVQFAINPKDEDDVVVIEMNPRVSRSSALASKATGYPIAKISALLSVGYTLKEIINDITKVSPVAFEPTLDYVAVKIPIFPFNKFPMSSKVLGPQMKSVGEVLALGGNFNEAFMKALRSLEIGLELPHLSRLSFVKEKKMTVSFIKERLSTTYQLSLLTAMEGYRLGMTTKNISLISKIDSWFLRQVEQIVVNEKEISTKINVNNISKEDMIFYKGIGFSDKHLALLLGSRQEDIFMYRMENNIRSVFKAVDTCSGEFSAKTPYFYSTYASSTNEAKPIGRKGIVVMGSGPNRIGQGIEFDYSCVKSCETLRSKGIKAIMINSNPETVSTDYDTSDRLYITPLYHEDIFGILIYENPKGFITSFSGQTGIGVRRHIENTFMNRYKKINFLGSSLSVIESTENRNLFAKILKGFDISKTRSKEVSGYKQFINSIVDEIGFPAIIRPSYVIGGDSMYILNSFKDIQNLPKEITYQLEINKIQVENYLENAIEYDVDLIRDKYGNNVFTICEHTERAGVHSGDSGTITPPVKLKGNILTKLKNISIELANKMNVIGSINFQFAVENNQNIFCIEANPRGSRTLPFLGKANKLDLPGISTKAMLGEKIKSNKMSSLFYAVKQPTFPFDRFLEDNIILGPKMRSTGESFGIDRKASHAVLKSHLGNYSEVTAKGNIFISLSIEGKDILVPYLEDLHKLGYRFWATEGTHKNIIEKGVKCKKVSKNNVLDVIKNENFKLVFNTSNNLNSVVLNSKKIRNLAVAYGIPCFTREETIIELVKSIIAVDPTDLKPINLQEI